MTVPEQLPFYLCITNRNNLRFRRFIGCTVFKKKTLQTVETAPPPPHAGVVSTIYK